MNVRALPASLLLLGLLGSIASAQTRYAQDPAVGVALPVVPLAGDQDATATVVNPAGLVHLGAWHVEAAVTGLRLEGVQSSGAGVGLYAGTGLALPYLPRLGFGIAVEQMLPPREALAPDPGRPLRLTLATASSMGLFSLGVAWHHHFGNEGATAGLDTVDLGLATRLGSRLAFGLVVRDLAPPVVAGVPLERKWDAELVLRPTGTDRLELAAGVVFGDRRESFDPRGRLSLRLARGLYARASFEARSLFELADGATGGATTTERELRGALGLEVSFGGVGLGAYGIASSGPDGDEVAGATVIARWSGERYPSVMGRGARIVRLKLKGEMGERELTRVLLELRRHEREGGVRALFLQLDGLQVGWGTLGELRDAIARLRARGTKVFAYLVAGTTRDYYLAAAADRIYLDAGGGVRLIGMSSSALFFKDVFDKLGVVAQFEKIEEYKSAPEAFTEDMPSPEASEMRGWILDDLYERLVADLARDRELDPARVRQILDEGPYTAGDAAEARIVDAVVEPDDVDQLVAGELGALYPVTTSSPVERSTSWSLPQVAVIYLDGDIVDGKSKSVPIIGQKVAGGETLSTALAWARENPRIKAVVLRVNSPGGSALASELMAREGFKMRGHKPFIVSIGDVAASGGYFAAAPGDVIFAQPSSITGSIGIFSGKFDLSGLLARLGVSWDTQIRGEHADMESYLRPYTDDERVLIKKKLRYYYLRFVGAVARGRSMTETEVDAVGRGQVWTGAQAMQRRLVDRHGGIVDAVVEAKKRAGLGEDDRVELVMLPREPRSILSQLVGLGTTAGSALELVPLRALGRAFPASLLVGPTVPQARLPFVLVDE